jgi:hypothetical protein
MFSKVRVINWYNRYTEEQILSVRNAHREAKSVSDHFALGSVRLLRWGMDFVTGYRYSSSGNGNGTAVSQMFAMTERKWLTRFIFLESVAGVPGMVAGMLRHLKSIRRMKRDYGWYGYILLPFAIMPVHN